MVYISMELEKNAIRVSEAIGTEALQWAKNYCPNYITNRAVAISDGYSNTLEYVFYFVPNSPDMTAFALRWGN